MQVKKFEAPTIAEALKLVKTELGPEAIILSTKNHRKGFGLLSKASVEVTAAVADKSLAKKQITERLVQPTTKEQIGKLSASKQAAIFDDFNDYVGRKKDARNQKQDQNSGRGGQGSSSNQRPPNRVAGPPRYADIDDEEVSGTAALGYSRNGKVPAPTRQEDSQSGHMAKTMAARSAQAERARAERYAAAEEAERQQAERQQSERMQVTRAAQAAENQTQDVAGLHDDIERLKAMLEELKTEQTALSDSRIPESTSDEMQAEFQNLLRNGIDKRYATQLIKQTSFTMPREGMKDSNKIIESLAVEMMEGLKIDHPLEVKNGNERRVFAFIGPTGVGKTTTIAKLASQAILQRNLRVGLINVDTYKVAALDQLATYAKILNVPFRSATNATELDRALSEFKPLDLVLIDTTGRSQRDSESLIQMKQLLTENASVRPLLIMSATTRDQELYDIVTRFKIFNPTGLIFSKLDETSTFGCIYNVSMKTGIPLTYFTVGQRVPEDIEPASRERVADLILDL